MENLKFDPESLRSQDASPNTSKASPAIVSRGIQALFSAYRSADFADAEGFTVQLGTVLSEFEDDVVTYVTDPRTGLQRRSKWPPTISEVLSACEERVDHLEKLRAPRPTPQIAWTAPRPADGNNYGYILENYGRPIGRFENAGDTWNQRPQRRPRVS